MVIVRVSTKDQDCVGNQLLTWSLNLARRSAAWATSQVDRSQLSTLPLDPVNLVGPGNGALQEDSLQHEASCW
jgi:hypothetical protein